MVKARVASNIQMFVLKEIVCFLLIGFVIFTAGGCGNSKASGGGEKQSSQEGEARKVKAFTVKLDTMEEVVNATGTLAAYDRAVLSVKSPGRLQEILADLGSSVKKGDLLARIETTDYNLRVEQAVASLNESKAVQTEARRSKERVERLKEQGIVPQAEVETVEAAFLVAATRLEQRQTELNQAQQNLKDTQIIAPFEGVVERRQASPGEFLNSGTPVVTLVRIDPIRLRLEVAEGDASKVRAGQEVRIPIGPEEAKTVGKLNRVSPVISQQNRMLNVEADIPNPEGLLRPGAFVDAQIVVDPKAQALVVPASSLITFAGVEKVILAEGSKAKEMTVSTGRRSGQWVEITEGLKPGDKIVSDPGNIKTGQELVLLE